MRIETTFLSLLAVLTILADRGQAADWSRFRGPNGAGISSEDKPVPVNWSETENLKWKVELPGPGSSSPIIVGDRVFVTCWTGYAAGGDNDGRMEDLKRVLVCLDRQSGSEHWQAAVDAVLPEESYRGMFAEHGYASHTPVSDGERVFVFFGKSGVHAYDMAGKHLWKADVGDDLDRRGWGSSSSPILYKDFVIVTASIESHTLYALKKETGEVAWKQEAEGFGGTWGTPALVEVDGRTELVIGVPYEIWGLNPDTGKLVWYCEQPASQSMCSSVVVHDGVVYAIESGPGGGGGIAVRAGGKGDVTESHVLWTNRERSRIGTPVFHEGRLCWVNSGVVSCVDAKTGRPVEQARLGGGAAAGGEGRPSGGRRFGGGGRGGQDYSSPVVAGDKLYYVKRSGDAFVVKLGEKFEQLSANRFESDRGDFSASPAISNGELYLRSSNNLYCIASSK